MCPKKGLAPLRGNFCRALGTAETTLLARSGRDRAFGERYAIPSRSALLTGVRVRGQAPEKHPNSRVFFCARKRGSNTCAAIFAAPSAQPRRHCLPAVDAIAPSANDTLFRRAPRSLRGFESEGRHQTRIKRTLMKSQSSFYFLQEIISD